MKRKGLRDLVIGLAMVLIGLGITFFSYSSSDGGSYSVYWGLVVVGIIYAGKGLFGFLRGQ